MKPTQDEIDEVRNKCSEAADEGRSQFNFMTYEQGVEAGIRWMQGTDPNPLED